MTPQSTGQTYELIGVYLSRYFIIYV